MEKAAELMQKLLLAGAEMGASDIHLVANNYPIIRILGKLEPYKAEGIIDAELLMAMIGSVMNQNQKELFLKELDFDFSISVPGRVRYRANAYFQKGTPALSLRFIPEKVPTISELGLPEICHSFAKLKQGFILVTGPTGAGKSTTLAAIIDEINENRFDHIVTIEDPIEFVHENKKSFISQRELGGDTKSWGNALKSVLREDPNVVYIGEMRDPETMQAAMTVAETGHLVFATLHTNTAAQSVERIVDSFPEEQQAQVVLQLSMVLEAVLSQRLLPTIGGKRVVATEIMVVTPAVRNNIREGKTFQIDNVIQTSGNLGMSLMENSLADLVNRNVIDKSTALEFAIRPSLLDKMLGGR
ncbi:MAG: twitching motility protein [uncultured bacterium]|nr:MAG: twitching motility protein [uncultured bacterium]